MPNGLSLGADPELIFVNARGIVSANQFFERQHNNDGQGGNPELGGDGHPWTAEARPKPATDPIGLVDNLEGIFKRHYKKLPEDLCWVGGSFVHNKSIGGHIHFGGIALSDEIRAALDGLVAQTVILLEDEDGAKRRRATKYGKLGDIRIKDWGFEYRPLPSWIVSKPLALGVVSLAVAAVFEEVDGGPRALRKLTVGELDRIVDVPQRDFNLCRKSTFRAKFPEIFTHIMSLSYWRTEEGAPLVKYAKLIRHVVENYPDWHNDKDILDRWNIRPTPKFYKHSRTEIRPVIQLDEILNIDAGWDRLAANIGVE